MLNNISNEQPLIFFPADQLIDNKKIFNSKVRFFKGKLTSDNICIFGIKPNEASDQFGYFLTDKTNKVTKFIEKPKKNIATQIIKKGAFWNSGIFYMRKDSLINLCRQFQPILFQQCMRSVQKSLHKNLTFKLNKSEYKKINEISFDYAVLEKVKNIIGAKIAVGWSDLGSWRAITLLFKKIKNRYYQKKNTFLKPWGKYFNLHRGDGFLIKELVINKNASISLQKHKYRSEHWTITNGKPKVTIDKKILFPKINQTVFIPLGSKHRVENNFSEPVKIIEAQVGHILKETDIIRYIDQYNRI